MSPTCCAGCAVSAHHYGADLDLRVLLTIGQPERLATALCGVPVEPVLDDGSPRGTAGGGTPNRSTPSPGPGCRPTGRPRLVAELVRSGQKTIAFCRSRRSTEVVAADVRRRVPSCFRRRVKPYRGGYLADERREIEEELFGGHHGVIATNALELGIDVGGLDAGRQRLPGRSPRSGSRRPGRAFGSGSSAVLVAAPTNWTSGWRPIPSSWCPGPRSR